MSDMEIIDFFVVAFWVLGIFMIATAYKLLIIDPQ